CSSDLPDPAQGRTEGLPAPRHRQGAPVILPTVSIPRNLEGFRWREPDEPPMSQASPPLDPWRLVWGQPYIDSRTLAAAIEQDLQREPRPDFRTRLLVRDAAVAIRSYWGAPRFTQWLAASPVGPRIRAILGEDLGETGFSTIRRRLVDSIDSTQLSQIFELLGRAIHHRVEVHIAGSIPTLVKGLTARPTIDIDFVDEVPAEIRRQRTILREIESE